MKSDSAKEAIRCPHCNCEAFYRYGKTYAGIPRFLCLQCNRQFTTGKHPAPVEERPKCPKCGKEMHLYRRQADLIRFQCSTYPACRGYQTVPIKAPPKRDAGYFIKP